MKRRTFYRASRLDEVLAPPSGKDFDPYRDTRYSSIDTSSRDEAIAFAAKDYHECGRIEERITTNLPGISDVIAEWMAFPDGSLESCS